MDQASQRKRICDSGFYFDRLFTFLRQNSLIQLQFCFTAVVGFDRIRVRHPGQLTHSPQTGWESGFPIRFLVCTVASGSRCIAGVYRWFL